MKKQVKFLKLNQLDDGTNGSGGSRDLFRLGNLPYTCGSNVPGVDVAVDGELLSTTEPSVLPEYVRSARIGILISNRLPSSVQVTGTRQWSIVLEHFGKEDGSAEWQRKVCFGRRALEQ